MRIKVGQIYQNKNLKVVITFVGIGFVRKEQIQCISLKGFTYGWSYTKAERYLGKLIAEYPTWQEAVNSKDFNE